MPKSKTKRKMGSPRSQSVAWGGPSKPRDRHWNYAILGAIALAIGYGVYAWWDAATTKNVFTALAESGQSALKRIELIPSKGGGHLSSGQTYHY